ncbi:MAG: stage III sporulation AC/AD family protein [Clostridia bacterium]|nr:stage III sporulation AC/AD family protein [Clostridia bacterium]
MDIFRIAGIAVITAILSLTLRGIRPELGAQTAIAGGAVLLLAAVTELSGIAVELRRAFSGINPGGGAAELAIKVAAIAYIAQLAADICRDSGENALAAKTEICGRLLMISAALPMLIRLARTLIGLIEGSA